ncbi:MAG: DUF3135 domain-containing protein [Methylococcales bacterium]
MPETENNPANHSFPKFDFDEWALLAKQNPEAFEIKRRELIENTIARSQPERQQRLRCLQWKIDQIRDRSPTPISACVKLSNMMWDSLTGPGGLKESLEQVGKEHPAPLPRARVLNLPAVSKIQKNS